jgi:Flp pilus assembly pilin Flp
MLKLVNLLKSFKNDESGAVTVDWVVLTGAVVGLALLVGGSISGAIETRTDAIAGQIEGTTAPTTPTTPTN